MTLVSGSKGHHGVKRASNYHPWMLNMTTCADHQLFIFREKLWIFLSALEVGNLSLFTTFKKQFGLGRWKRGPPRIEHSIHSNFPPLNISLLQFREFPLHTMCAQWWPLIRSQGIQDVQMCRTAAYSWRYLTIYNDSYLIIHCPIRIQIQQHLKTLCLMLCMEFCIFDLNEGTRPGKSMTLSLRDVFADTAARVQSLVTAHHHHKATRKDSPILAEPQHSINNVKAWAVLQNKASFADDFRARPIVNEEEGFVAEKTMCFCTAAVSLDVKPRPLWNNDETYWLSVWEPYF